MRSPFHKIQTFFERQAFGVCEWWGIKLGIKTERIRKSFIYLSFVTAGSSVVLYLIMAFILENKHYFKPGSRKRSIWDI
ncbi:MAG: PspC family transcriptional regulator [Flavobacteriales bacterium]|nr:PspC family transcriptional regulator [Flavobacteriales bacterium]